MQRRTRELKKSIAEKEERIRWLMKLLAVGGSIKIDRGRSPFAFKKPRRRDDFADAMEYFLESKRCGIV